MKPKTRHPILRTVGAFLAGWLLASTLYMFQFPLALAGGLGAVTFAMVMRGGK